MKRLKDFLDPYLENHQSKQSFNLLNILKRWDDLLGPFLAAQITPVAYQKGVLICQVSHSTLIQELRFIEKDIINKLRFINGGEKIRALKLVVSAPNRRQDSEQLTQISTAFQQRYQSLCLPTTPVDLSVAETQQIYVESQIIQDEKLRIRSRKLIQALSKRQKQLAAKHWPVCTACQSYYEPLYRACPYCHGTANG